MYLSMTTGKGSILAKPAVMAALPPALAEPAAWTLGLERHPSEDCLRGL